MIRPEYVKRGDTVAIAAPSRWVTGNEIDPFLNTVSGWGLKYKLAGNLFARENQLAGDKSLRARELLTLLHDPEVKAVFCARGGYGAVHLLDEAKIFVYHRNAEAPIPVKNAESRNCPSSVNLMMISSPGSIFTIKMSPSC